MIDIHSHILWGLDDGAKTLDDAVAMLTAAAASGTTDIVATPHADLEYDFDPELVEQRIAELNALDAGLPRVHYGCDFHLSFDNLQHALQDPACYTVNHGPYLMIEFPPDSAPPSLREPVSALIRKGLVPVITHPERNAVLARGGSRLDDWLALGCLAQVTGGSLWGRFGEVAEQAAWTMLQRGQAHFVASDAHGTRDRTTPLDAACDAITKKLGPELAQQVLELNPRAVIEKAPLPIAAAPPRKGWFRFFR